MIKGVYTTDRFLEIFRDYIYKVMEQVENFEEYSNN